MKRSSITEEDYLKCIHEFMDLQGYASLTDIAHVLRTVRQTVFDEIKILMEKGFVDRIEKGRYILNNAGQMNALKFLRKHRVAEILLWKGLGMKWSELDDQAMGIEHGMTDVIIERVCKIYGCQKCPHGNVIPDSNGDVNKIIDYRVSDFTRNKKLRISRIVFESPDMLEFLEKIKCFRTQF
ncbi:Iron dependent repressor [mine drainage metagenome]|uniref:Iron dependent repressor n=1 Tax=mine drainage metagenome TaxID=410659 RepID=T0ZFU4_9ZZZZ